MSICEPYATSHAPRMGSSGSAQCPKVQEHILGQRTRIMSHGGAGPDELVLGLAKSSIR